MVINDYESLIRFGRKRFWPWSIAAEWPLLQSTEVLQFKPGGFRKFSDRIRHSSWTAVNVQLSCSNRAIFWFAAGAPFTGYISVESRNEESC